MDLSDEIKFKIAADLGPFYDELKKIPDMATRVQAKLDDAAKKVKGYIQGQVQIRETSNKAFQESIQLSQKESKIQDDLIKKARELAKQKSQAFDSKKIQEFSTILQKLSPQLKQLGSLDLSIDDIDQLTKVLNNTKDDAQALNKVLDLFENKLAGAFKKGAGEAEILKEKIERTSISIKSLENLIKDYDNQIDNIGPGKVESGIIADRNKANKSLQIQNGLLEKYKAELKEVNSENISLSSQLRKVKDDLVKLELEGKRNTDRYDQLKDKAEKYKKILKETNDELNRNTSDTKDLDNIIGAVNGIVGVYSAAQGAQALFGEESEDLQKALVKLNGALALLNGLQAIQSELAKKEAITTRALTFVKAQYAIATDSAAKASVRFRAALNLTGIGLLITALSSLVVYWDDIAEAIGLTNKEIEATKRLSKSAADSIGSEVGKLKALEVQLIDLNTPLETQKKIRKELLDQYPNYLKVLKDEKATADEITEAFEKLNKALFINAQIKAAQELISDEYRKLIEAEQKAANAEVSFLQNVKNRIIGGFSPSGYAFLNADESKKNLEEVRANYEKVIEFIRNKILGLNNDLSGLGGAPGGDSGNNDDAIKQYEKFASVLEKLIKRQRDLKTSLIENDREREKQILKNQFEDQKSADLAEIEALKGTQKQKLILLEVFNKAYNEKSGDAYELLRKNLKEIDDKYNKELEEVKANSLNAINAVYLSDEQNERLAIKKKYDAIKKAILDQIEKTNDELEKTDLRIKLIGVENAEEEETNSFDRAVAIKRLEREKEIAKSTLEILKTNNKNMVNLEKVHQLELLALDEAFYKDKLRIIKDSFEDVAQQDLLKDLTTKLQNSKFLSDIESIKEQLIKAFGEETAAEIIKTVEALNKVQDEIEETDNNLKKLGAGEEFKEMFSSFENFFHKLGDSMGLVEDDLKDFTKFFSTFGKQMYSSFKELTDLQVNEQQRKVDRTLKEIDRLETVVDKQKEYYDRGVANSYQKSQQELQILKEQKREEEAELQRALKKKEALQKAEFLIQTAQQVGDLITASTNIIDSATGLFGLFGVPIAAAAITAMFSTFFTAKATAYQAISESYKQTPSYRTGLKKGRISLEGPSHEQGGLGLYDSRNGQKVAEMEAGEDLLVFNRAQKSKYQHIIEALISDARGEKDLDLSMRNHYKIPRVGQSTHKVIERVNKTIEISRTSKSDSIREERNLIKEFYKLREDFNREFKGFKKERDDEITAWETKEYYWVKKGSTTKKYKKE